MGNWYTDINGQIILPFVEIGWYIITELRAAPGMTLPGNPTTRIYLAPGANAYSNAELTDSQNSSGENNNSTGPVPDSDRDNPYGGAPNNGTGIIVWTPNSDNGHTTNIGNGIIVWRPSTGYENAIETLSSVPAFEFCPEIEAMSNVVISGINAEDITGAAGEYYEIIIESDAVPEQIFTIDEIAGRVLDGEPETYYNENYDIQTIAGDDIFTDNNGRQWKLDISNGEAKFIQVNSRNNIRPTALSGNYNTLISMNAAFERSDMILFNDNSGEIIDFPLNAIIVKKTDAITGQLLPGATFELFRMSDEISGQNGTLISRFTTDNSGIIAFIGLPAGTYFVKEVQAPANYTLNVQGMQTAFFAPDSTTNIEFTFANYPYGSILVNKIDAVTNSPLAGARFELKTSAGAHVAYGITDNFGSILFSNLEPGSYIVSEIEAPSGYQIDTHPQTVYVPADGKTYTVYFKNQPYGSLVIVKKEAKTNIPISGVRFKITDIHGANIGDITPGNGFAADGIYTTDGNGVIRIDNIPQGYYLITEVFAPEPYILDESPKIVYAEWGKIKTVEFWNSKTGALVIAKYDAVTKMPLKDAVFKVTDSRGAVIGESGGLFRTDETGHIYIYDLLPGNYRVYEESAPAGYILDSTIKTIEISDEKMYYLEFFNEPVNSFTIMKYDADTRQPLQGAVIRVQRLGSTITFVGDFETDADGKIVIENLLPGSYSVQEIQAPQNYVLDNTVRNISLEQNRPQVVTLYNSRYGDLLITKIDGRTRNPIENVKFRITQQNGTFVGEYVTDSEGYINLSNLVPGMYIVQEIETPSEYVMNTTPKTVEIISNQLQTASFVNRPKSRVHIRKLDADTGTGVAGAVFTVETGNTLIGTFTSGVNGEVEVGLLEPGNYTFTEITPPPNYTLNGGTNDIQRMTITDTNEVTVTFQNHAYGNLLIIKRDEFSNAPLGGAEFTVSHASGAFYGNYTTMPDGTILIPNIEPGIYLIRETRAPNGYLLDNAAKTVTVPAVVTTETVFLNRPKSGIQIVKTDSVTRGALSDAEFKLTRANGEVIGVKTTDIGGNIIFDNLEPGTYIVTETRAPQGYVLDATSQTVVVTADKITTVYFENRPLSDIKIIKTDSVTKAPLSGAAFRITRPDGSLIGIYTTNISGLIQVGNLTPGVYIISETAAPEGYVLDSVPKTVEVIPGRIAEAEFENRPHSGLQIIKKNSETGATLAGAEFRVTKSNGETVGTYTTDSTGTVIIENLAPGHYIVTETKAPQFYVLNSTPKTIEIRSGRLASVEFLNIPFGNLVITKTDRQTSAGLQGAVFEVKRVSGEFIGQFTTGASGTVVVQNLVPGAYIVTEIQAPPGYEIDTPPQTVQVGAGSGTNSVSSGTSHPAGSASMISTSNNPYGTLEVVKLDKVNRSKALEGATFELRQADGTYVATKITDISGKAFFGQLKSGNYVLTETVAPRGYEIDTVSRNVTIRSGNPESITFYNNPFSSIEIIKTDAITHRALSGATFEIARADGSKIGTYRTDSTGKIIVPNLEEGVYIISETIAPNGYVRDELPKTVTVTSGRIISVEFTNRPHSGIEIHKTDAVTKGPLSGASFEITRDNGERIGTYRTDRTGKIIVPNLPEGTYIVSEAAAPTGYVRDEMPKTVIVRSGSLTQVEFENRPHSGIQILKTDAITHTLLAGASFEIRRANGELIGTYRTDRTGQIIVSDLAEGIYVVSETIAPSGYQRDEIPKNVTVISGRLVSVEFVNKPFSSIQIIKLDAQTRAALPGAEFLVERANGERIGTYKTDLTGKIIIPDLNEGVYIISEIAAPQGYILDEAPRTVTVRSGVMTIAEFMNKPLAGLRIIKLDSETRTPIEGVEFSVNKVNGERVESEFRGYTFKTDRTGQIYIPQLDNGYYIVTETRTVDGYFLDSEPKTVRIESGKTTVLEVLNTPMAGLLIVKTDAITGKPLQGVVFDIRNADGSVVTGNILDGNQPNTANNSPNKTTSPNGDITGSYTTDANGRILINGLAAGQYTVTERKAAEGYELDPTVYNVTVIPSRLVTLQLTNTPKSGLRLIKTDSVTGKPIYNVEFMLFDANGRVVGVYRTDNNGIIDFPTDIPAGRYTIRETKAAAGYHIDDIPKTVDFIAGKVTEINWTNTPHMGQIQITKKSADDNTINGFTKGRLLEGAVFEIYDRANNLVDTITSNKNGLAVSKTLPIGRYTIKEVKAPANYLVSDKTINAEIEFAGQIVRLEIQNKSIYTNVSIQKRGYAEVMPGQQIRYDFRNIANNSNVALDSFYWRDTLPTDAVRLNQIVTGTWSHTVNYMIVYKTNKNSTQRTLADNLSTDKSRVIDASPAALGLAANEYVTEFTVLFGRVPAGFKQVNAPYIICDVLKNLSHEYRFTNKSDVGGLWNGKWIQSNDRWVTVVYNKPTPQVLPRTGY